MTRNVHAALVACALCSALPAGAQRPTGSGTAGGAMSPRITYDYQYADSGAELQRRYWIRSIVLWREQADPGTWKPLDRTALAAASRVWRAEHRTAEDSGWTVLGSMSNGVLRTAEVRNGGATLYVLGRTYAIPERDSTLVVMVDRSDSVGAAPYVAGATYVHATLPDEFWPRSWTRGDTTFFVHARGRDSLLAAALRNSPAVAAFIR